MSGYTITAIAAAITVYGAFIGLGWCVLRNSGRISREEDAMDQRWDEADGR